MKDTAPIPVISYAASSTSSAVDPSWLTRPALRFGFVGVAMSGFYLPGWLAGRVLFGYYFDYSARLDERLILQMIPAAQAALIGAGLALTLAARQKGRSPGQRWKYLVALTLNVLGAAAVLLQVSGALESGNHVLA